MALVPFLDGLVAQQEILFRSATKFSTTAFRVLLLNGTSAMTENEALIPILKREPLEANGYSRTLWTPTGAAVKDLVNKTALFDMVYVTIAKPASPVTVVSYDCMMLLADSTAIANRAVTSIASSIITCATHSFVAGDRVFFDGASAYPTLITADTYYFVSATSLTSTQFRVAATSGGAALAIGSSFTGALAVRSANGVAIGFDKVPLDGFGNNTRLFQPGQNLSIAVQTGGK